MAQLRRISTIDVGSRTSLEYGSPDSLLWGYRFSLKYEVVKRAFDVIVAVAALILVSPLMILVALAVKLDSPGPIFFRQARVGRYGASFKMLKFRSMRHDAESLLKDLLTKNEADGAMFKICDDPRITRVGRVIRRLCLDELPQLFNVLIGEMSLVGPRPPLPREVEQYKAPHMVRLAATPGLTGLWQVNRGAEHSFDEMVQLDRRYIEEWSLTSDLGILLKTIPAIIRGRGIS